MKTIQKTSNAATVIKNLIEANGGKIFTVDFVKADGTHRTMNARLGVKKDLKGGENSVQHIEKYITAFDMQKGAYRNINAETVTRLRMQGTNLDIRFTA